MTVYVGVDIAKKSYDRVQRLFEKGVVTAQKHDEAEACQEQDHGDKAVIIIICLAFFQSLSPMIFRYC